jgi:hypothetical protein
MRVRLRCGPLFDITLLPTKNHEATLAEIRRLRQQLRHGGTGSESTGTVMDLALYNLFLHLGRYESGNLSEEQIIPYLDTFFQLYQNVIQGNQVTLYVREGTAGAVGTKYTVDLDEHIRDRPLLEVKMIKVCASPTD